MITKRTVPGGLMSATETANSNTLSTNKNTHAQIPQQTTLRNGELAYD